MTPAGRMAAVGAVGITGRPILAALRFQRPLSQFVKKTVFSIPILRIEDNMPKEFKATFSVGHTKNPL